MANPVQFKASAPTIPAVQKDNFYIGTAASTAYGPTSATDYFAGKTPPSSEYVSYINKASGGPSIRVYDSTTIMPYFKDLGYVTAESSQFGRGFSSASLQNDICITNKDLEGFYPGTSAGDLSLHMDAGFTPCFASGSDTATAIGKVGFVGTLEGTTEINSRQRYFSSDGGYILFQSSNRDKITTNLTNNSLFQSPFTLQFWVYINSAQSDAMLFYKAPSNGLDNSLEISIGVSNKITITVGTDTRATSTAVITQNAWNHITIQLTANTNYVRINDGTAETATRTAIGSALTNITSTAPVIIGSSGSTNLLNGSLAILTFYKESLSQSAQLQNWNALKSRFGL